MTPAVQALAKLSFFARFDENILQEIASYVSERTFQAGQTIISEGDLCQAVYFVARGVVRIWRSSLEGREHILAYLGPGEPFNLVPALDGKPNPATVNALTDVTLYTIPCERCHQIMYDHHEVALAVLERLAAEVRRLSDMVEDLALHPVRARLARFLLNQVSSPQPSRHWTQEDIAAHIGTVREMVGRTLRDFASEGLIRRERGRIVVVNRERLEREATGG
ncbi:MAG: Crp/Fnr family transcriptional regulator [Anaerolineae bacterium]|jgi:CRP/FNR family transcriptional regulator|nr:Crp/Fnr family transcriptional regulator [Anaerolineae bacterium]MDH7475783.1 Crp/Fnr family transcriptional regulator [Anaerolineae bacterium]